MESIIASVIFIVAMAAIVGLVVYKTNRKNKEFTFEEFIDMYYDNFISILQDVVYILLINVDNFNSKEEYEKTIISTTIEKIYENCTEFGIDSTLLNLFDRSAVTDALYGILHDEEIIVFSGTVPKDTLEAKPNLYSEDVIAAAIDIDEL